MRLLFTADIHGAGALLRKSLRAATDYSADVLVIAGDLSGKQLHPVIELSSGQFRLQHSLPGETVGATEVEDFEARLEARGEYSFRCSEEELQELRDDHVGVDRLFNRCIMERLKRWRDLIRDRLDLSRVRVVITPGNDDPWEIDETLASFEADGILSRVDEPMELGAACLVTLDVTNPTPWATPRELSERQLLKLGRQRVAAVERPERAIFNFHCPPHGTRLDLAPKLDANRKQVTGPGGIEVEHVGSTAVRKLIEECQPAVGLHGHIHEAEGEEVIGRTLCLNPGSEYWTGVLHGYVIDFDPTGKPINHFRVEG